MEYNRSAKLIVLLSFLIHTNVIGFQTVLYHSATEYVVVVLLVSQAIAYLLYPLVGWLSDVYFTRYRFVMCAFVLVTISSSLALFIIAVLSLEIENDNALYAIKSLGSIVCILFLVGLGIFESTAIQFGMDQMVEDNSFKLSSFIHWYYWSTSFSRLVCVTVYMGVLVILRECNAHSDHYDDYKVVIICAVIITLAIIQIFCAFVGLCLLLISKKHLNIDPKGYNPLKLMYQVLKYSWKHKVPENRSAFTYWENDIPARIDLGKHKYGGPFTIEDVEDTKTFLRIFLVILSLLGFQLSGYGYSIHDQLIKTSCPPFWLLVIVGEPMIIALLVVSIGEPFYQWIIMPYFQRCIPNMLKRIGLGLFCCLAKQIIDITLQATTEDTTNCHKDEGSPVLSCYVQFSTINDNGTCIQINASDLNYTKCSVSIGLFPWLVVSSTLQGMSLLLVFLTFLGFICAQAPLRLKGLLVGIWYASLALNYMFGIADIYTTAITSWRIFNGIKAGLILLSLVVYICVSKWYRYRERDEVVNEQFLVEEIYEKELNQVYKGEMRKSRMCVQRASERRPLIQELSNSYEATS